MTAYTRTEIGVGLFLIAGLAGFAYLTFSLGELTILPKNLTHLDARFQTVGALKRGAAVRIAGVKVGKVHSIVLRDYAADVQLEVEGNIALPVDTIASIRTVGLLGESYLALSPGAADKDLRDGDRIAQTESPLDLVDLVSKYAFGGAGDEEKPAPKP